MNKKVIVVGAGASGLMAAGTAAKNGNDVILLERNDKVGRKIMITGKGRCNVTNATFDTKSLIDNVPRNGRFLYSAFSEFSARDTMDFFEELGVPLKVERGNRVFPVSDKAVDIVDALNKFVTVNGVKRKTSRVKSLMISDGEVRGVKTEDGLIHYADSVIVATGGLSYPKTGSTGDGYSFAKQAGHTVTACLPSLVALECREGFCGEAMGLSLRNCALKIIDTKTGKQVYSDFGEMLFTHFGVSGPVILSASSVITGIVKERPVRLSIDLKPAITDEQLDERILRDFSKEQNKAFKNSLDELLPKKLIPVIVMQSGIKPEKKVNEVTREERQRLVKLLKNFDMTVTSTRGFNEAIITQGGVNVKEINPSTMESKLVKNIYFAGEVIDVDAVTGGFNLQVAWSTAYAAASHIQ